MRTEVMVAALVAACGPGLKQQDTRVVGGTSFASAADDPARIEAMLFDHVINGGLWFEDAACAATFGSPGEVKPDQFKAFARCLAGLQLKPSTRKDALGDVVVMHYAPGFEVEARVVNENDGWRLAWIGFESRRNERDNAPTITVAALEALRISGEPHGPIDPDAASLLEVDVRSEDNAAYTWIKLCIDETGAVQDTHVHLTTSEHASKAFTTAAKTWTFRPFLIQGQPVPVCAMVRMTYPASQAPAEETLPMPPRPSKSKREPIVFAPGSEKLEGKRISGNRLIVPDDDAKRAIRQSSVSEIRGSFRVCVDESGRVESVLPMQSTGVASYDRRLIGEMYKWVYSPYSVDGQPVPVCTHVVFIYRQN